MASALRFPSKPDALAVLWASQISPEDQTAFVRTAVEREKVDALMAAGANPGHVLTGIANPPLRDRWIKLISKNDRVDLLAILDAMAPEDGLKLRQFPRTATAAWLPSSAIHDGSLKVFKQLVDDGVDPFLNREPYGTSLFHYASVNNFGAAVDWLIQEFPEKLDSRCKRGRTALHAAVRYGQADMAGRLLAAGADKEARDDNCRTPFYAACIGMNESAQDFDQRQKWIATLSVMLQYGANPEASTGKTDRAATIMEAVQRDMPALLGVIQGAVESKARHDSLQQHTQISQISSRTGPRL
jgi:hypothetical protein